MEPSHTIGSRSPRWRELFSPRAATRPVSSSGRATQGPRRDASSTDPGHELRIRAADGYELAATVFEPGGPLRGVVLVAGATAVPRSYYAPFGAHLAAHGLAVVTYDYRGIGGSRPDDLGRFRATMTDWARLDTAAALDLARRVARSRPVAYVGHSFGGQALGLLDDAAGLAGVLLVGAQLGFVGNFPPLARPRLHLLWNVLVPVVTSAIGYFPGELGLVEDLPGGVAAEWAKWCRHPEYLLGYHPDARARLAALHAPVVAYGFSDDDYAPRRAVEALTSKLGSADVDTRFVSPGALVPPGQKAPRIGHFGFFRPAMEALLWPEARQVLDAFVDGRVAPPPIRPGAHEVSEDDVLADLAYGRGG